MAPTPTRESAEIRDANSGKRLRLARTDPSAAMMTPASTCSCLPPRAQCHMPATIRDFRLNNRDRLRQKDHARAYRSIDQLFGPATHAKSPVPAAVANSRRAATDDEAKPVDRSTTAICQLFRQPCLLQQRPKPVRSSSRRKLCRAASVSPRPTAWRAPIASACRAASAPAGPAPITTTSQRTSRNFVERCCRLRHHDFLHASKYRSGQCRRMFAPLMPACSAKPSHFTQPKCRPHGERTVCMDQRRARNDPSANPCQHVTRRDFATRSSIKTSSPRGSRHSRHQLEQPRLRRSDAETACTSAHRSPRATDPSARRVERIAIPTLPHAERQSTHAQIAVAVDIAAIHFHRDADDGGRAEPDRSQHRRRRLRCRARAAANCPKDASTACSPCQSTFAVRLIALTRVNPSSACRCTASSRPGWSINSGCRSLSSSEITARSSFSKYDMI